MIARIPVLSVVIPTYNRARFVTQAIDSALAQGKECEVIVVDDGSTDDTRALLNVYGDRLKYLYQSNAGVSRARNAGIEVAQGEWITFLDSDDAWLPNFLPQHLEACAKNPDLVATVMNVLNYREEGGHLTIFEGRGFLSSFGGQRFKRDDRPLLSVIEYNLSPILQGSVFRRDVLLKTNRFDASLSIAEDLDIVSQMALMGPFVFAAEPVARLMRRSESIANLTSRWFNSGIYSRKCLNTVYSRCLSSESITRAEQNRLRLIAGQNLRALGNHYLRAQRKYDARRAYIKALEMYPCAGAIARLLFSFLPLSLALRTLRGGVEIQSGVDGL
jgi:glycosyltransferase involved in cell wall biosynthesis